MKVFLSGLESSEKNIIDPMIARGEQFDYCLSSYFYACKKKDFIDKLKLISKEILIDSGAHSFQKGKKVNWVEYTKKYAEWITKNDNDKIVGYFEMDVDNVIGYENVLYLRKILESVSDKIIPVWHKNRGIEDFKQMCEKYAGKIVAITGFKNEDIQDHQYLMFLKYAKKFDCKVHCLGMTRTKIMDLVPFYSVDSSTWKQAGNYGEFREFINGRLYIHKRKGLHTTQELDAMNVKEFAKMQNHYYKRWLKNG
jgi:hypothetical protein